MILKKRINLNQRIIESKYFYVISNEFRFTNISVSDSEFDGTCFFCKFLHKFKKIVPASKLYLNVIEGLRYASLC
jgi:hypothetical protein